jgi:hypothetical protein
MSADPQKFLTFALTTAAWQRWRTDVRGEPVTDLDTEAFVKNLLSDGGEPNDAVNLLYVVTQMATLDQTLLDSFIEHSEIYKVFDQQMA